MPNSSSESWVNPTNIPKKLQDINSRCEFELDSILELIHDLETASTLKEVEDAVSNRYEEKVFLDSI